MRHTELPNTSGNASVLGFGCSAVLGRSSRRDSLRALAAAYDAGINVFDTARSYGYGESEALIGEFFRGRRQNVLVSTKFGIVPTKPEWWKTAIKPLARSVRNLLPSTRKLLQNQVKAQFKEGQFTAQVLRDSLSGSLRALRTDHVDFLFAHSPSESILENVEVLRELERSVESGKVRFAGVSASPTVVMQILQHRPAFLKAFQFPCNLFDGSFLESLQGNRTDGLVFVANQPFGGSARVAECRQLLRALSTDARLPAKLSAKLSASDDQIFPEVVLNAVLSRTGVDIVVPAMMKLQHLQSNVAALESCRFSESELLAIRGLFPKEFDRTSVREVGVS